MISSKISPAEYEASWLSFRRTQAGSSIWNASEWVIGCEIYWAENEPQKLFEAIVLIASNALSFREQQLLGTGPIEALLANHFGDFASKIILLAESNENIREALDCVTPNDENDGEFAELMLKLNE